jgi:hypothetical protein
MSGLRELAGRLELPSSARKAFLDEVSGDLEELYTELRARGLGPTAAWRAAAEMLLPDDTALRELMTVHRPLWVRWGERLTGSESGTAAVEATMVVVLTVVVLSSALIGLLNGGVLAPLSWALAPVLTAGLAASVLIAAAVARLLGRGQARADRVRERANRIAAVGALAAAAGALSAGAGFLDAVSTAADTGAMGVFLAWIPTAVAQLSLGLVVAMECGIAWLLLARHAARLETDAARALARVRGFHFPGAGS